MQYVIKQKINVVLIKTINGENMIQPTLIKGNGAHLALEIMNKNYQKGFGFHPWADSNIKMREKTNPNFSQYGLQAHHIITIRNLNSDDWKDYITAYEYNINSWENGVMLPSNVMIACQAYTHVHRSNHSNGIDITENVDYIKSVGKTIDPVKQRANKLYYCKPSRKDKFTVHLNLKSKTILEKMNDFKLTISIHGNDYSNKSMKGCSNGSIESTKKGNADCRCRLNNKSHGLLNKNMKKIMPRKLEVGF